MSITGSYVILAVIVLRFFLKKAPKKYSYLMWTVCAFRLCCPISFKNIFSIFNLRFFNMPSSGATLEHIPQNIGMMNSPAVSTGINSVDGAVNGSLPAATPMASVNPMQIIIFVASVIWLAGIAALLIYSITSYIMLRVKLRNAVIYEKNVYQSDKIGSPFVFGLIRPKIYIPFSIDENEMSYVLAHERYHIKRRDYIIKPIAFLILTLHWFNPLCHLAFMLMSSDMEMSCDEKVISDGRAKSKEYSGALLSLASRKKPPAPCPLAFGETGIKGRIKNILKYKKPRVYVSVISVMLCAAVLIACASNPNIVNDAIPYDSIKLSDDALTDFGEKIVGSSMAEIDYADDERIIFHFSDAVFVYNLQTSTMEKTFDLNNLDCAKFQQGDYSASITVSDNGKEALLVNYGSTEQNKDFKNYIINLESGSASETDKTELKNPFSNLADTFTTVTDSIGWTSVRCAGENDSMWYLTCDALNIGNMRLCLYKDGKTVSENPVFYYNPMRPADIYDLVDARLIVQGKTYPISDKNNLPEIEKMFSTADVIEMGGTGCPFGAVLIMTRADGATRTATIATDSCAVYRSDGVYYDYSDGDNSRFFSMFGLSADTIEQ